MVRSGIEGCARFVQRLWRLFGQYDAAATGEDKALDRKRDQIVHAIAADIEALGFNKAVARLYELANAITEAERAGAGEGLDWARMEALTMMARLAGPMMPHLAEEVHALLRPGAGMVADLPWPEADPILLAPDSVTIAVQVMGKLRGAITVAPDASAEAVISAAESEPNVARLLAGKRVVKRIHVPGRIVNFVIAA